MHPEKRQDRIVRVAGYSALFNVLSPQAQNDIIARTEQQFNRRKTNERQIGAPDW